MAVDVLDWGRGHGFEKRHGKWKCLVCDCEWTIETEDRELVNSRPNGTWDMPCPACKINTTFIPDADKEPAEDDETDGGQSETVDEADASTEPVSVTNSDTAPGAKPKKPKNTDATA